MPVSEPAVLPAKAVWEKLGRILAPDARYPWMSTVTGAAFGVPAGDGTLCDIYVAGRDDKNRTRIGKIRLDLENLSRPAEIGAEAVLSLGELGAFDENGTGYPCLVRHGGRTTMYYVGWMPTVLTPCQNQIGLAVKRDDGSFARVSRAPILDRTDDDFLSLGSSYVLHDEGRFRMWYTSYAQWGKTPGEPKHTYFIKYAESADGVHWKREGRVCISPQHEGEFAICRPSVVRSGGIYHMWYAARGEEYRIGYAFSKDGLSWTRRDELAGIAPSGRGWDSRAVAYPHVFDCGGRFYMLYCGNDYGREGLGLARLKQ